MNTTAKHTPGPWYRNIRAGGKYPTVFAGDAPKHVHIAHVQQIRGNPDETEANIDLIAAAPELLEALKYALNFASPEDEHEGPEKMPPVAWEWQALRDKLRSVIAKAEGR